MTLAELDKQQKLQVKDSLEQAKVGSKRWNILKRISEALENAPKPTGPEFDPEEIIQYRLYI